MKKIVSSLVVVSLFPFGVLAEEVAPAEKSAELFFGVDFFQGESDFKVKTSRFGSASEDFDQSGFRVKFGVHDQNNIRFQGYFKVEDTDDFFDEKIYGLGADAMFTFPAQPSFTPYLLVGFSSDWMELNDEPGILEYSEDSINAFTLKGGLGALFRLNQTLELQAGFDVQYRSWQDIQVSLTNEDIEQEDTSKTFYLGFNIFF